MGCPHCKCLQWQEDFVKKGFIFPNAEFTFDLVPFFVTLIFQYIQVLQLRYSDPLLPRPLRCNDFASLANCFYLPPGF